MTRLITTLSLLALLFAGSSASAAQVSFGIRIGPPPAPRVVRVQPRRPGPEYVWIQGYWYPAGGHYRWHNGYWTRPPFGNARWVGPRYEGNMFYEGYWDRDGGRFDHNHRWDRDRDRDWRRGRDDRDNRNDRDDRDHRR